MRGMSRLFLIVLLGVAARAAHKHHPKFPKASEEYETTFRKVACSSETERKRNEIIEKAKCGAPKDVFIYLEPKSAHEQVSPGAVWVKRCVGLCDYDPSYGSKCVAIKKRTRHIPIRVYNVKTDRETCSTYPVEEHVTCGCCTGSADSCAPPQVYDPPEPDYEVETV